MSAGRMFWVYSPLMGGIVVIATHIYSAHRISILYNSRTPGFIVAAISVAEFAAGLVSAVHLQEQAIRGSRPDIHFISILIWTPLCVLGNITITILMAFWFLHWGGVGSKTTQTIVAGLLRLTIETGVILALTIIGLTLLFNHSEQPYFITFAIAISKCHSVTWLALLNNRTSARRLEDNLPVTDIQFQAVSAGVRTDTVPVTKFNHSFARPGGR
ncbi:hypothetical protein BD779DRAFT_1179690 [Infundibulicybe gibba]|nr:hypothetical protein BD779DRAFT_1179690 [Infundibulicybe gibba]